MRKESSFKKIVSECPININSLHGDDEILVAPLSQSPEEAKWQALIKYLMEKEGVADLYLKGQTVYFLRKEEKRITRFSNNLLESKLKVVATTRNWRTIIKLSEICEDRI